jgi:probable rRNA maturation factor
MIKVFNKKKLLKLIPEISLNKMTDLLSNEFSLNRDVNVVFVDKEYIQKLNTEYRKKNQITDVLSFNIDSEKILGEVYICPEYVVDRIAQDQRVEEIVRLIIHGILHLQGYKHNEKFQKVDYRNEPMYIKQEDILNKILKEVK